MPTVTRWFVRSALLALLAGIALTACGDLLLPGHPGAAVALRPAALHLLTVGWLTQMVFGVAFWMFPRLPGPAPRGSGRLGFTVWGLLNAGLLLRVVAEPWRLGFGGPGWPLAVSAFLQLAAATIFVAMTWPRVRVR